ncbi:N-acetylmuramoyl-L-alanine amidase [Campylobacter sp. 19-13652]|uniref:N-acetylmuramoyl-L-alanine amidase family protein n=1 Tax=Campylobacter sp. 19-13652 TaxID=2840180 RepID=UPI001C751774|nr:N-acetylmuramoyl-L-alanine amidase [Campylobacter sp. 19-13652]BCX79759.1 hypothetical protein LBC_12210 [Campylobacter sp. 19-13652]
MLKKILTIICLCSGILLASGADFISQFDNAFKSASISKKRELLKELNSLYVKAIIGDDDALKEQTLTRLIEASAALGLDNSGYKKDLLALKPKAKAQPKPKTMIKEQSIISSKKPQKPIYLMSAVKKDDALELKFNQNISDIKTRTMFLNTPPIYRNVLDIQASLNGKSLTYQRFLVDKIRIAQFDKEYVRVVFESQNQKVITAQIDNDKMLLRAKDFVSKEAEVSPSPKVITPNKSKQTNSKQTSQNQANQSQKSKPQQPLISPKKPAPLIVIDPGHGGTDPGAIGGKNMYEKTAVLAVAKKLGERLKNLGYRVKFTRDRDVFINLRKRTKFANDSEADIFISIHANAAPNTQKAPKMKGIETFFLSPARSERSKNAAALENKSDIEEMNFFSQQTFLNFLNREKIIASNKLGIDIHRQLLKRTSTIAKVSDGGVREAPFWVLVGALMPAVLVEIGYITHPVEGKLLFDNRYQNELARGIAEGVVEYFKKNR